MKRLLAQALIGMAFAPACYGNSCPDPNLQQAVIGGDTIDGSVLLHHKPLKFKQVRLWFLDGKTAWVGATDKNGGFHIKNLRPDTYRLEVQGWGSTMVRIDPALNRTLSGQTIFYWVGLTDSECIGAGAVTN